MTSQKPEQSQAEAPQRQAHGSAYSGHGEVQYLLGDDCVAYFGLQAYLPYLVRPRFIRAGQSWPAKGMPAVATSKLQVRCQPDTPASVLDEIKTLLLSRLPSLKLDVAPEITLDMKACCFSPCFGCLLYSTPQPCEPVFNEPVFKEASI